MTLALTPRTRVMIRSRSASRIAAPKFWVNLSGCQRWIARITFFFLAFESSRGVRNTKLFGCAPRDVALAKRAGRHGFHLLKRGDVRLVNLIRRRRHARDPRLLADLLLRLGLARVVLTLSRLFLLTCGASPPATPSAPSSCSASLASLLRRRLGALRRRARAPAWRAPPALARHIARASLRRRALRRRLRARRGLRILLRVRFRLLRRLSGLSSSSSSSIPSPAGTPPAFFRRRSRRAAVEARRVRSTRRRGSSRATRNRARGAAPSRPF